jgi:hypothetical protein
MVFLVFKELARIEVDLTFFMEEPTLMERPLLPVDDVLVGRPELIFLAALRGGFLLSAWNCVWDDDAVAAMLILVAVASPGPA